MENRSGASGTTGSDYVAKAAADGYTLLVNTNALAVSQIVVRNLPFNVLADFAPLSLTMTSQNMVVAKPSLPVASIRELIAHAKANPGKLSYGASGLATPMLSMELLKVMTGMDILFVPYKGDAPGIIDLLGGQTDLYVTNILPLQPHVQAGKLRALAVTSRSRAASLPEVPTVEEAGVPGFEVESWFGFLAPARTPQPVVDTLNAALVKIVAMPDVQQKMADTGGVPGLQHAGGVHAAHPRRRGQVRADRQERQHQDRVRRTTCRACRIPTPTACRRRCARCSRRVRRATCSG